MAQNVGGTAVVSEMSSSDQVIKFLLDNKIQRSVVDEILERGFDSLEALSLLDPEDIKSQKIPVGQRRLLVHVAKSLVIGGTSLQKADHGSQPTPSTSSSDIVHVQPVVEEQDDVYSQTLINSLVAQQTHLAGNQASGAPPTNNSITPASANLPKSLRVNLIPQVPVISSTLHLKWEEAQLNFGLTLTSILLEYWENRQKSISDEIDVIVDIIKKNTDSEEIEFMTSIVERINLNVEKTLTSKKTPPQPTTTSN